jgi:hypothetical protein
MNKNIIVAMILGVVLLSGCTAQRWKLTDQGQPIPKLTSTESPMVGADRDEHGCIGSAGYSWCESKSKCLRVWEEPCELSQAQPTADESVTIKTQIKEALVTKHGSGASKLEVTVSKIEGNYAKGGAAVVGEGGGMWFGAKVGDQWKLVWDGNGIINCSDLTVYPDFPATMIPECFDVKINKMVKR